VSHPLDDRILKGVSRSFFLSLRLLPKPMREAASLGYLLARTSDTLADSAAAAPTVRLAALKSFGHAVATTIAPPAWPPALTAAVSDPREQQLIAQAGVLIAWLRQLPDAQSALVREVVATIISGQQLDLERFATATREHPIALATDADLEDYAWRVAGCVGEFWTKLGLLTLGTAFSRHPAASLLPQARAYGKALQLVNILRDLPADLAAGRCYLPVPQPLDRGSLLAAHTHWLARAATWLGDGRAYAATLPLRRLRAASLLPALLAAETLERLRGASWKTLEARVKVPRHRVYALLLRAVLSPSC
jgi:farnesyl-diphosphate farnesyltransferase